MNQVTQIFRKARISMFLLLFTMPGLRSQDQHPGYLCDLRNDIQVDIRTYEFDIYLLRTESTVFEYSSMQFGININSGARNGGTITVSLVSGSSELNVSQIPDPLKFSFDASKNSIIMTGTPGPGSGSGTIISNTGFGTRIGRIRLVNTANFGSVTPDLTWSFLLANGYATKVNAYIPSSVDITVQASHTTSNLSNNILNAAPTVNPTATPGTVCAGDNLQLNAGASGGSGSYTYTWTSNPAGFNSSLANPTANPLVNTTYNVAVFDGVSTVNSQVSVNVNALPATPTITASGPTTFCPGGSVTLTSSSGATYLWSNGATTPSINVTTSGSYSVQVTNASGCHSEPSGIVNINTLPTPGAPVIGAITQPTLNIPTGTVVLNGMPATGTWTLTRAPGGITTTGSGTSTTISDLPPGTYTYTVIDAVGCISPASANIVINAVTSTHFIPVWWPGSGLDHMNLYALTAKLDNIDLQPGDEIGIFDGDVCVGTGTLTQILTGSTYLSMVVSKDDPDTPAKDGYTPGNTISFKVWDSGAGKEVSNAQADYVSGSGIFSVGGTASFNLNAVTSITQDISLTAGWNIMSFAGGPDNMSLSSIVNSLKVAGTLVKIQDEKGSAIEQLPAPIGWVDNIGLMKVSEGYKIKVSANTTLSVTGKPVTLPYDIDLSTGWNIMGYPSMSSQAAMAAFQSLINSGTLLKVQDEKGSAIEQLPAPIGWVDNIHTLAPGEGYKIKVSAATSITINNSAKGEYENTEFVTLSKPSHFKPAYTGNGFDHMNIYLKEATNGGAGLQPGDEIGVFDGGVCVGSVVVEDPDSEYIMVTASFDDPTTKETDGFIAGHNFTLKLWDRQTGVESNTKDEQYEKGSGNLFERLGTSVLMADFDPMSNISFGYAYPNPSTEKTTFTFEVAGETDVRLEIFNMRGDLIKVLVDRQMPGGVHHIEWDNRSDNGVRSSSGIYFYRLILNNILQTKQLILN